MTTRKPSLPANQTLSVPDAAALPATAPDMTVPTDPDAPIAMPSAEEDLFAIPDPAVPSPASPTAADTAGPSSAIDALVPAQVDLSPDILARFQPDSIRAESIRAIRTYLIAQHLHEGRRALAVCAASQGVGCTFVAANLAYVLAQAGVNTLLIDGDLRDPSVDRMYVPAQRHAGLAQCLAVRDDNFGDYITPGVAPNLSVLYSGGVAEQPQELLAGAHFKALMDFCLREYDFTIIDTPPANLCADGRRICTVAGYAIIVAAKDLTFAEDVKTLASQIEGDHARVVGTVLRHRAAVPPLKVARRPALALHRIFVLLL